MLCYNTAMFSEEFHSEITVRVGITHDLGSNSADWLDRLITLRCPDVDRIEHLPCNNDPLEDPIDMELDITVKDIGSDFTESDARKVFSVAKQIHDDVLSDYVADGRVCVWIAMYTEDVRQSDLARVAKRAGKCYNNTVDVCESVKEREGFSYV